ncbi:hypothetical protein BCT73_15365 [Vibrio breoganii]|nr:hypothetical protein A6D95_03315 [Vibrio breoganii]PMG98944.1 hypothetical protein BCU80_03325 [Vibrio breoganii]PMK19235.1 hypothetical protein BCU06_08405 [Vibrio breoganii]PML54551.1 hypothetical protein BCT73_15365 [Vibrio breoganii]PMO81333.1 hypothetical protein BCT00_11575 [Vibrio breoganii]
MGRLGSLGSELEANACHPHKGQHKVRNRNALVKNEHRRILKHRQKIHVKSCNDIHLITCLHFRHATDAYECLLEPKQRY